MTTRGQLRGYGPGMAVTRPVTSEEVATRDAPPAVPGPQRPVLLPDVALAAAVTAFAQLDLRLDLDNSTRFGPSWAVVLCSLVATGALAFRRRAPLATMLVVAAAVAGPQLATLLTISLWGHFAPLLVAAYSVARHADRRSADAGLLVAVMALVVVMVRVPSVSTPDNIPFTLVPLAVVTAVGRGLRRREMSHAALALEAGRLAEDREAWVREAVAVERARIARELHDVVAHSVSVMVVQAGAAAGCSTATPGRPREALLAVAARPAARRWPSCASCSACCAPDADARRRSRPQPGARPAAPALVGQVARRGPAGRARASTGRRATLPAAARPRRLPDRAGGADQRAQARRRAPRPRRRCATADDAVRVEVTRRRRRRGRAGATRQRPRPDRACASGVALYGGTLTGGPCAGRRLPRSRRR